MQGEADGVLNETTVRTNKLVQTIFKDWKFPEGEPRKQPLLLMVGGFQGSGKSTLLQSLGSELGLATISGDQMRQSLVDNDCSEETVGEVVDNATRMLFVKACKMGISFAIDRNAKPENLVQVRQLLEKGGFTNYRLYSIFLNATEQTLKKRVADRPQIPGTYSGSIKDLQEGIDKHGDIDKSVYDLVIDTDSTSADMVRSTVLDEVGKLS